MSLEALVSESLIERVGWTLLHFVWQGGLVAAILGMALLMLRRHSAASRYAAACGALSLMAVLPVVTFYTVAPPTPPVSLEAVLEVASTSRSTGPIGGPAQPDVARWASRQAGAEPRLSAPLTSISSALPRLLQWRASDFLQPMLPWTVYVWFIGTLVLSVRLSGGWALAQGLRCVAVRLADERWQAVLSRLCRRLRISRPVQLLESGLAQVPTVVGWLRPVVLLPASAVSGLSPAQIEAILAHELAHVRRCDYLVNLLQSVAEVLLFYHPAVWWVSSRIRVEREHCWDDVAVGLCGDAVLYARALTELELLRGSAPEPAIAATGGPLLRRIRRLVGPSQAKPGPSSWPAGLLGVAVLAALLIPLLSGGRGVAQRTPAAAAVTPQVELVAEDGAREGYPEAIRGVVSSAKEAFDQLFPDLAKPGIRVEVRPAAGWYEYTTTDRDSTIYVGVGAKGVGDYFRADTDALGLLCEAVAELHNANRLSGFDRYVAHRYLAPAVVAKLGLNPLPDTVVSPQGDDVTGMLGVMTDPIYAAAHPDFAAVCVLVAMEGELGPEESRALLVASVLGDAADPFAALRKAALAKAPALEKAFALCGEANALGLEEDGTCLVASFEADEAIGQGNPPALPGAGETILYLSNELAMSQTDEWSTHGELSLKLQADKVRNYLGIHMIDPDWKFKDWTRFSLFQLDLMVQAAEPQVVRIYVFDNADSAHGMIPVLPDTRIGPGEPLHVVCPLTESSRAGSVCFDWVPHFDGQVRAREIADIQVTLPRPTGPFALYIDNIRLTPREELLSAAAAPAAADQARAQAAALLQEALAHKRAGQLQQAEGCLGKALELQPGNVEVHRVLAWVLVDRGRRQEAAAEFRQVIELTEDDGVRQEAARAIERLR